MKFRHHGVHSEELPLQRLSLTCPPIGNCRRREQRKEERRRTPMLPAITQHASKLPVPMAVLLGTIMITPESPGTEQTFHQEASDLLIMDIQLPRVGGVPPHSSDGKRVGEQFAINPATEPKRLSWASQSIMHHPLPQ